MILSSAAALRLVDAIAILISQAYQLARICLASAASPVMRLLLQRDHALSNMHLLCCELAIPRAQRESMPPHQRPDYLPSQRLAILQIMRLRGWSIQKTAGRFVIHPNTLRSWIHAVEGRGNLCLLQGAVIWNRIDDAVRWAVHQVRRLCPEPELGTRFITRQLIRAGLAICQGAWRIGSSSSLMIRTGSRTLARVSEPFTARWPAPGFAAGRSLRGRTFCV